MRQLDLRVPPVAATAIVAGLMGLAAMTWPGLTAPWPLLPRVAAGAALALSGLAICLAAVRAFRKARTTVNPLAPETATSLVAGGVYALSRNPMYLGMALVLAGLAAGLANAAALVGPVAFALFIDRFQIAPEERALARRFGAQFEAYRRTTRRWI